MDRVPKREMDIYPNPARDYFVCSIGKDFINPGVAMVNILGRLVKIHFKMNGGRLEINTNDLNSGFYFIRVEDEGVIYSGKVLLAR